ASARSAASASAAAAGQRPQTLTGVRDAAPAARHENRSCVGGFGLVGGPFSRALKLATTKRGHGKMGRGSLGRGPARAWTGRADAWKRQGARRRRAPMLVALAVVVALLGSLAAPAPANAGLFDRIRTLVLPGSAASSTGFLDQIFQMFGLGSGTAKLTT